VRLEEEPARSSAGARPNLARFAGISLATLQRIEQNEGAGALTRYLAQPDETKLIARYSTRLAARPA
jgi:hypothetical protein